ncbi:arylsulfatase B [Nilaparvata lugens]|uniref:arylsulfatase B n=1 Tax=Nilaparvata lugens TaxID=108931 RepID=UPI00193EB70E|nr:arylsulfatase B [Nilaparvata lugens]
MLTRVWLSKKQAAVVLGMAILSVIILAASYFYVTQIRAETERKHEEAFAESPRPHIVFILADDMGWNDVGFHGSNQIPTPNLDALAFSGIVLNKHYVQPVCTPSRAALMTGKYPIHTGMQGRPMYGSEKRGLPLDEKIFPQYLKDLGYATHITGKWHLGYYKIDYTPLKRGFDSHTGYWNGAISYYDHILQEVEDETMNGHDFRVNYTTAWHYQGKYATDVFTEEAEHIIQHHNASKPLFLYMPHLACHAGNEGKWLEAPQEAINKFSFIPDPNRRTYAAMVHKLDESVGRVVSALAERRMLHNSIIVFVSDNGAPINGIFKNYGSNQPLRGEKSTLWEGGIRTPAFVWSPLLQSNSRVSTQLMHLTDWLPTLYSAAGGDVEDLPKELDGYDMWTSLSQDLVSERDELIVNIDEIKRYGSIIFAENSTSESQTLYKLIVGKAHSNNYFTLLDLQQSPKYDPDSLLNSQTYKAIKKLGKTSNNSQEEINAATILKLRREATVTCPSMEEVANCSGICVYDLTNDPCEQNNLSERSELQSLIATFKNRYESLFKSVTPQLPIVMDPRANPALHNYTWSIWETS